jgi:hypothetical protein
MSPGAALDFAGRYEAATDHLAFSARIPDAFPRMAFRAKSIAQAHYLAVVIEEWVHRCQFALTPVGLTYRLCCLAQSRIVMRLVDRLRAQPGLRIAMPWLSASSDDDEVAGALDGLRVLESTKRVLLGEEIEGRVHEAPRVLEALIPLRATWSGVWQQDDYQVFGAPKPHLTTRAILESHASAMAFAILEREAPRRLRRALQDYVRTNRIGLYRSLEDIVEDAAHPEPLDLDAVLRLATFALDGATFQIPGIPPAPDYLSSALPYARYRRVLDTLPDVDASAERLGHALNAAERVEFAARMTGASGGLAVIGQLQSDEQIRADWAVFGPRLMHSIAAWGEQTGEGPPDTHCGRLERAVINEIVRTIQRYVLGVIEAPQDAALFTPTADRLARLCEICDHPTIIYPDGREIFFAVPSSAVEAQGNYETLRFHCAGTTDAILRETAFRPGDDPQTRDFTDPRLLLEAGEVALAQVAPEG